LADAGCHRLTLSQVQIGDYAQGIKRFFISDDDFARNKQREPLLDRLIRLRQGEGMNIGFTIPVDTPWCRRGSR
jgi:hypothetical protein